eukprot:3544601-Prymnesium_polylepis.1
MLATHPSTHGTSRTARDGKRGGIARSTPGSSLLFVPAFRPVAAARPKRRPLREQRILALIWQHAVGRDAESGALGRPC